MVQVNTVDLSEFQDPKKVDYQAMKNAGIETLIIRGSVDLRLDHHAAEHIANAKKYGFNWHLYHYFYNDANEAEFAVKAAKTLGLSSKQTLFLDMEDKSLPKNWNEQFSIFRNAVGSNFKVGLYCSDSPYQAKFSDSQLKLLGVKRWIASYSYEPKNYDIWQKSGAGSGGFGSYTNDIDRDVDPNHILIIQDDKPDEKPYMPTSDDKMVRQIILEAGYDTETGIYGLGCSYDNGKTFRVYWTIFGRKMYQEDADRLWPFLIDKIKEITGDLLNVSWNDIQNKPDVALKSEIPDLTSYAKKSELPTVPTDLVHTSDLQTVSETASEALDKANSNAKTLMVKANKSDIPTTMTWNSITNKPNLATKDELPNMTRYATIASLVDYVKKTDLPDFTQFATKKDIPNAVDLSPYATIESLNAYAKKTDIPEPIDTSSFATKSEVEQAQTTADNAYKIGRNDANLIKQLSNRVDAIKMPDLSGYAKTSEIPTDVVTHAELDNVATKIDTSSQYTNKKPSDYPDGFSYELKSMSALGIDRTNSHPTAQVGDMGLLITKAISYDSTKYVRQTLEQLDNSRPLNYVRNGHDETWFSWEDSTTW